MYGGGGGYSEDYIHSQNMINDFSTSERNLSFVQVFRLAFNSSSQTNLKSNFYVFIMTQLSVHQKKLGVILWCMEKFKFIALHVSLHIDNYKNFNLHTLRKSKDILH